MLSKKIIDRFLGKAKRRLGMLKRINFSMYKFHILLRAGLVLYVFLLFYYF